jgi:hypothetical protein
VRPPGSAPEKYLVLSFIESLLIPPFPSSYMYKKINKIRPSSTNKTECHDIAVILLKVVLNTITHLTITDEGYSRITTK